jgi:hypothetical protein
MNMFSKYCLSRSPPVFSRHYALCFHSKHHVNTYKRSGNVKISCCLALFLPIMILLTNAKENAKVQPEDPCPLVLIYCSSCRPASIQRSVGSHSPSTSSRYLLFFLLMAPRPGLRRMVPYCPTSIIMQPHGPCGAKDACRMIILNMLVITLTQLRGLECLTVKLYKDHSCVLRSINEQSVRINNDLLRYSTLLVGKKMHLSRILCDTLEIGRAI